MKVTVNAVPLLVRSVPFAGGRCWSWRCRRCGCGEGWFPDQWLALHYALAHCDRYPATYIEHVTADGRLCTVDPDGIRAEFDGYVITAPRARVSRWQRLRYRRRT